MLFSRFKVAATLPPAFHRFRHTVETGTPPREVYYILRKEICQGVKERKSVFFCKKSLIFEFNLNSCEFVGVESTVENNFVSLYNARAIYEINARKSGIYLKAQVFYFVLE